MKKQYIKACYRIPQNKHASTFRKYVYYLARSSWDGLILDKVSPVLLVKSGHFTILLSYVFINSDPINCQMHAVGTPSAMVKAELGGKNTVIR